MSKLTVTALVVMTSLAAVPASAGLGHNGISVNGISVNGISVNGALVSGHAATGAVQTITLAGGKTYQLR
jgi:hypothetical protein